LRTFSFLKNILYSGILLWMHFILEQYINERMQIRRFRLRY
jgi:hypothetical protein